MKPVAYGEDQPRLADDRLPIVLVVLDGLGDRAIAELGHRTPCEAADTPVLDRLAARGACGWHVPFGWGRAPSSELAHWAMFGYADVPFPGRAVLEAIGAGIEVAPHVACTFASLRTSQVRDGRIWITGRAAADDMDDAQLLLDELAPWLAEHGVQLRPLGRGEALLQFGDFARGDVSDSDPFFEHLHPWLRVQAGSADSAGLAAEMNRLLLDARERLIASPINARRRSRGRPPLDVLSTKWSGAREPLPSFAELTGVAGAAVTDMRLYRGLAGLLGMGCEHLPPDRDHGRDVAARIAAADRLIGEGAAFVHVHTKATDEAGHTKDPFAKLKVLEALDPGLAALEEVATRAIVAVTGDHATPSVDGVLHTGDPTPLLIAGPTVRADDVMEFGERPARQGWYGVVHARELLPLLLSHANRPMFMGHRATAQPTLALPDTVEAMPAGEE
jgi:2,3-bisphosphoglycerate-independent phosphoglycerate mutase